MICLKVFLVRGMNKMNESLKYVGKNFPIHDAVAKATGAIKYTGDMEFPSMLHAKVLFSPVPHAKILHIDVSEALALPGVLGVYTHENTPEVRYNSQVWYAGQQSIKDERIFSDTVRFIGDRIAAVVAISGLIALKAISLIKVEYEELPAVYDPETALKEKSKVIFSKEISTGKVSDTLRGAEFIAEDRVETPKIHHAAMETHVCLAVPDFSGKITVYTPCQILYSVRLIVANVLGMPFNKIRVIKTPMGGSFGGKQEVILEPLCAFLAKATVKPVRIELDRKESIISTRTRTRTIGYVKTAVSKDGKILAREVEMVVDTGAYTSNGGIVSMAMGKKLFRLYRIENQLYRPKVVHTNTPVAGAARGYGSPQIHAITEINLDHAARIINMDPIEFRLKNLVHPYDSDPTGAPGVGNARIIDCVKAGAETFRWTERREAARRINSDSIRRRGVGMACATHANGYFGAFQDFSTMTLRMLEDGSMILNSGIQDLGCGTVTTLKQIIAEVMDINPDCIEAPEGDTETSPYDIGSQASRVTHVCGRAALEVAQKVRELFTNEAAKVLKCPPADLFMDNGYIRMGLSGEHSISFGEMIRRIQKENLCEIIVTHTYKASDNPGSYGANFVELEVNTLTGLVKIIDILAVHDVGKAINPEFVRGQIYGGIQMGIGMALTEDLEVDPGTGRTRSDSFSKYHLINTPDMPPVEVILIEQGEDNGPFGAKSIGEIATCPTAPAIVNAVNHALGTNLTVLPLTPERIIEALKRV